MGVFGVMMVRNEELLIEGVVRHTLGEVDHLLVADNNSTDLTRPILDRLAEEGLALTVLDDPVVAYRQSEKVSALAAQAADMGATWVVAVDSDELWYSRAGRLREVLPGLPYNVVEAPLFNHLATLLDLDDPDPFRAMVWRQPAQKLPKVAVRWQPNLIVEQGNHGALLPDPHRSGYGAVFNDRANPVLMLRHFPLPTADDMIRKARDGGAAYEHPDAADLPEDWGRHWRSWWQILQAHGEAALEAAWQEHWFYRSPIDAGLTRDPAPYRRWETPA